MNAAGDIYLLEINPNCGVFYPEGQYGSADFILAGDPAGHRGFLEHLLACAIRRRDGARRRWTLQYVRDRGFGLFAARDLRAGERRRAHTRGARTCSSRGATSTATGTGCGGSGSSPTRGR